MRTVTQTVYRFDELTAAAKEKARDWYRSAPHDDFDFLAENVIEDADTIAAILGIVIARKSVRLMNGATRQDPAVYWSGFCSQGDGACFEGRYGYAKGAAKAIREHAPQDGELHRIADSLQALQRRHFYRLEATVGHSGRDYHAHSMSVDVTDAATGDDIPRADTAEELRRLLRDFANWIYRQLEAEYEYTQSTEYVDDAITANGYEFTEEGKRA